MPDIAENIARIRARIAGAAMRGGRRPEDVLLVAVTKTAAPERIRDALRYGLSVFGENRVQDAREKVPQAPGAVWHLIGTLQRNKVKEALRLFAMIQSVDSVSLAEEISRRAASPDRPADILIQVNISEESQKHGFAPQDIRDALARMIRLPGVRVRGLMGIAPIVASPEDARPFFRRLRETRDGARDAFPGVELQELSMGMTDDFEVAIEEGSTMVRIGRAVFS